MALQEYKCHRSKAARKLQCISSPAENEGKAPAFNVHDMTGPGIAAPVSPIPVFMATHASMGVSNL